jgi:uncharacterized protein (TIGR02246 family)
MTTSDETAIKNLIADLMDAWKRGDAQAYGAHYRADGTFTNVNGTYHVGPEEFDRRHAEIFRGIFKATTVAMRIKNLRFAGANVAVVDIDTDLAGCPLRPPGVAADADGTLHTCLLMVRVKEAGKWWISAYHNVWRAVR